MLDIKTLDDLTRRLAATLPPGLHSAREDLEGQFRDILQAGLGRLDLVTREEFDVQTAVLRRTREQLDALAARIDALSEPTAND